MDFILAAMDPNHEPMQKNKHHIIKTSKYILKHGDFYKEYTSIRQTDSNLDYKLFVEKINSEIYMSTASTFSAISKRIRKTILHKHRACIVQMRQGHTYCPYAFAYTHWRKFIENHDNWRQVDNGSKPKTRGNEYEQRFISKQDDSLLYTVMLKWQQGSEYSKYKHLTATKWLIDKVLAHVLLSHFYKWLEIASTVGSIEKEIHRVPFHYNHVPFFVVKTPKNNREHIEFHWWEKDNNQNYNNNLNCPNEKY